MAMQLSRNEEVLEKIDEIRRYYDSCEVFFGNSARISKVMLAFTLGLENLDELEPALQELCLNGQLAGVRDGYIYFANAEASVK
jgi:hypothetical protein